MALMALKSAEVPPERAIVGLEETGLWTTRAPLPRVEGDVAPAAPA